MKFNAGQLKATDMMLEFLESDESFFLLSGAAGTGKTTCIKYLVETTERKIVFTAPTNKATKVLRSTLTTEDFFPACRTIYSLLGLKLEPDGAIKTIKSPDRPIDLTEYRIIVVDEASMVNELLWKILVDTAKHQGVKFIFLGDQNQLPPVGEARSKVWEHITEGNRVDLLEVMRFDNQILTLAEQIKTQIGRFCPTIQLAADNDEIEGVWLMPAGEFRSKLQQAATQGDFTRESKPVKAIAWRNLTVARLNKLIRYAIFDNAASNQWLVGDRVILTSPATDPISKQPVGSTDDEGVIERIETTRHPLESSYQCYKLSVLTDENKRIDLWVLHESSAALYKNTLANLAAEDKHIPRKWRDYWALVESFHQIQHGYAITAHRAQGSTYDTAYVVWNDILLNRNRNEGFRCLYVAATRPKKKLIMGSI